MIKCVLIFLFPCYLLTNLTEAQPWTNPLMMAWSNDGISFGTSIVFQDSSGVPSAIKWKGDTLICVFQWARQPVGSSTWDKVAVKFSYDNGNTWTDPEPIAVNGLPSGYQRPFDPTLALLDDESIRIYFSSSDGMPPAGQDSIINTYSARGSDGIHYQFEPDPRVDHPSRRVIDPAVIRFNNSWHYESPKGAPQEGAFHYISPDGIQFSQVPDIPSDPAHNWTGNYLVNNASDLRFYGTGVQSVWFNSSPNGGTWSGYVYTNITGGDPTVVKVSPDNYLMIYTGPQYPVGVIYTASSGSGIRVYPNPASDVLFIEFNTISHKSRDFILFNLFGNKVMSGKLSEIVNEINIQGLVPGGYFLSVPEYPERTFFIIMK
jgi:hypothetical protein